MNKIWFTQETSVLEESMRQLQPNAVLETVKSWLPGLMGFTYNLAIAILILVIGMRVAKSIRKMLSRSFERMDMEISLRKFLLSFVNVAIYCLLFFIAADRIGINSASIVAVLGSAGLALGLALQGSLANFAGGVLILLVKPFKVGDYISSSEGEGTVTLIGLVYTTLNTVDNKRVVVPNGSLANTTITNATAIEKRRVDIQVGIGYSSDLKKAKEILLRIFTEHPKVMKSEAINVFVDSLADSAVMLGGRGWVATDDYWQVRWDIMEAVKLAFDETGIEIPFGQLDVHIKQ